ncbi:MAG: hypothetical protein OEZ01_09850 [Candidatus Heimdallarchaeota archaeon]|nr:hypothetical protein [Candidatus Heimdallarchaeota archaeon]MDH5646300.1 hypothetical protein [Candidatus Heimdallarchaeota archaeon]
MKIAVLIREVVDLVEELSVEDGSLVRDYLMFRSSEFDDYAVQEALQLKDDGDTVDIFALDGNEIENLLYMAKARGADGLYKVVVDGHEVEQGLSSRATALAFSKALAEKGYDLLVTGVQGVDDIDGPVAGHLGQFMNLPSLNVIVKMEKSGDKLAVFKEYAGGLLGEYEIELPAVCGIQASQTPPSYIPVSKVRKVKSDASIEEITVSLDDLPLSPMNEFAVPESGSKAEMIGGDLSEQVAKVVELLSSNGVL